MNNKLSPAEIDVLKAYRDNTTHNRKVSVTSSLLRKGLLAPAIVDNRHVLVVTEKGKAALKDGSQK